MAAKTVINTNIPQAKQLGISIIIDQDQTQNLQLVQRQRQRQDQHQLALTELGNCKKYDVEVSTKQEMSPNSPATKKTNRNNVLVNVHQANDSKINDYNNFEVHNEYQHLSSDQQQVIETGYTATTQTFPPTLGERGKLEKAEMVKTAAAATTGGDNSVELLAEKSPILTSTQTQSNYASAAHIEPKMGSINGITRNAENIKKTIIKCNIERNNSNDHTDEFYGECHNEESVYICSSNDDASDELNANDHGQFLCNGLPVIDTHSQKLKCSKLNDVGNLAVSRLTKAEVCASATFETNADNEKHIVKIKINPKEDQNFMKNDKQVTLVQVNEENLSNQAVETQEKISVSKTELNLNFGKMVQKPSTTGNIVTSGNTTVTELNVSNPSYLYYTLSSGQFSPCDTLDSGTGSDLESNGNSGTSMTMQNTKVINTSNADNDGSSVGDGAPKLELHLKTTKIHINNGSGSVKCSNKQNGEHQRAGSLTDSEESETSSLSYDSLHSTEYVRQLSASPSGKKSPKVSPAAFLPDSLLRDIRDRKFPTNDFETKYGNNQSLNETVAPVNNLNGETENGKKIAEEAAEHAKYLQECKSREINEISMNIKRSDSLSKPDKTFIINTDNGIFVDTKMNSMPRKYEADKYYNFHVNEHENFHSFSHNNISNGNTNLNDDEASLSEYDIKSKNDDDFAGYKDIRCNSVTSTIRSSKGTVRGVKNRVRNGIATFLQMQQPHVKNYLDKDFGKVVLYTTSMGIIRDTYAKCSNVKQILRTLLVKFEERDIFMSVEYQAEIKDRMHTDVIRVPQLFVEGQHIGDAETVERLNESGELRQLLKPYKSIATTYTCQTCGGYRLLPCPSCNGSKKSVHRNHFTAEFVALKCMNCDEVGLVKCHNC